MMNVLVPVEIPVSLLHQSFGQIPSQRPLLISDNETKEIPDPFPFPATYSVNVDVAFLRCSLVSFRHGSSY